MSRGNPARWSPTAYTLLAVAGLALSLRLVFIFGVSTIPLRWDAAWYWGFCLSARDAICTRFGFCTPLHPAGVPPFDGLGQALFLSKQGLLPLIVAPFLTVLPTDPRTAFVLFAMGDALACAMLVHIVLRLGGPLWVGAAAGLLQACYVPAIVGDAAFLQQPLIRIGLTGALWSYVLAFTAETAGATRRGVVLGTIAMVVVGFSSVPTRPLMWVVPIGVILACAFDGRKRHLAVGQAAGLATVLGALVAVSLGMARQWAVPLKAVWPQVLTGLSAAGTVTGQVTPLSFSHFWPPDDWWLLGLSATTSLANDLVGAPLDFLHWSIYSLFSNWRYPDYIYFQAFVLAPDQQKVQHILLVAGAMTGFAWLAGQPGPRQRTAWLGLTILATASLIYGIITVEPRRLASLSPLLSLGAACAIWSLAACRHLMSNRRAVAGGVLLIAGAVVMWLTPVAELAMMGFGRPEQLHVAWVLGRSAILVALAVRLTCVWGLLVPGFVRAWPVAFVSGVVVCSIPAQLADSDWRQWSREVREPVRQRVTGLRLEKRLHPWLLVDVDASDRGAGLAIFVNDRLVKAEGVPMYVWEAGVPPTWPPYVEVFTQIANFAPTRRLWLAYPLRDEDLAEITTIQLEPRRGPAVLRGDLLAAAADEYVGPIFDPWCTGRSLWRWMWNAADPRIPGSQSMHGARYMSTDLVNGAWISRSASTRGPFGLYRVFVTEAAFGVPTNALNPSAPEQVAGAPSCRPDAQIAGSAALGVCRAADGAIAYVSGDMVLGRSAAAVFQQRLERDALVDRVATTNGRIDVLQILQAQFVANLYRADGSLIYSAAFSTR